MTTNQDGIDLIKSFESLRLHAYPDPGTGGDPWTIGYGHTGGINQGDSCSEEDADNWLQSDLQKFEDSVTDMVTAEINENQFSALVCFCYNLGAHTLANSTLMRKVNAGDFDGAAAEFLRWNKAGGQVMAGLTRRRAAEQALFEKEA